MHWSNQNGQRPVAERRERTDTTQTSAIRQRLRSMILGGELRPGQRLPEKDICDELDVGRTPLREALLYLEGEGYVTRQHGWTVASESPQNLVAIFEGKAAIEGSLARLAAARITPEEGLHLSRLVEEMEPGPALPRHELNRLNDAFHERIACIAQNRLLSEFRQRTLLQYWLLQVPVMFTDDKVREANEQHRIILDALTRKDGDAAEKAARAHVHMTQAIVAETLGEGSSPARRWF